MTLHIARPAPHSPGVCPTELALDVVASKWTVRIIYLLAGRGVLRFSELRRELRTVTHKELTKQLRRLEHDNDRADSLRGQEFREEDFPELQKLRPAGSTENS